MVQRQDEIGDPNLVDLTDDKIQPGEIAQSALPEYIMSIPSEIDTVQKLVAWAADKNVAIHPDILRQRVDSIVERMIASRQ